MLPDFLVGSLLILVVIVAVVAVLVVTGMERGRRANLRAEAANARLMEQIREQAERERLVYEITGKIRRSTDIQSILATTASELTKVIGARRTKIEVMPKNIGPDGNDGS